MLELIFSNYRLIILVLGLWLYLWDGSHLSNLDVYKHPVGMHSCHWMQRTSGEKMLPSFQLSHLLRHGQLFCALENPDRPEWLVFTDFKVRRRVCESKGTIFVLVFQLNVNRGWENTKITQREVQVKTIQLQLHYSGSFWHWNRKMVINRSGWNASLRER